jgi:hypothetical protein
VFKDIDGWLHPELRGASWRQPGNCDAAGICRARSWIGEALPLMIRRRRQKKVQRRRNGTSKENGAAHEATPFESKAHDADQIVARKSSAGRTTSANRDSIP